MHQINALSLQELCKGIMLILIRLQNKLKYLKSERIEHEYIQIRGPHHFIVLGSKIRIQYSLA